MKKIFIIILMFLMFVSAFSFEKVYLDENEYKIYKKSVSEMPKTAYNAIVDFMKHDAIFEKYYNNLNSNFIIKHTFLFDPKNISKKEFDKDYILYTTCLTGMDIFTLFNKKENKAFILNKNSNNEQLSYLVNFTFDGGLLSILKSENLEYFYKAIFDLTYGVTGETGMFLEAMIRDIDDISGNGRIISLISIKKSDLLKIVSPSMFTIIGNMNSWEGKFCAALKDGEVLECTVKGTFFDGDRLKIDSISNRVILEKGMFKLLYIP